MDVKNEVYEIKWEKCHRAPYAADIERGGKKKWRAWKRRSSGKTRAIQRWKTSSSIIVIKRNKRLLVCVLCCFFLLFVSQKCFFFSLHHDCATMLDHSDCRLDAQTFFTSISVFFSANMRQIQFNLPFYIVYNHSAFISAFCLPLSSSS